MNPLLRARLLFCGAAAFALWAATVRVGAEALTSADLGRIFTQAADRAAELSPRSVIAVVDRDGRVLLVRRADGGSAVTPTERALAVSKAGTAVFLSSNGHAFSSRTAGFIIQQHFPPGILNHPPGPLVGVGFSNLAYSDINYFRELDGSRIPGTRLNGSPGGVPLYKNGVLLAAVGVTGDGTESEDDSITGPDVDEAVAMAGQLGYTPPENLEGSHIFIGGIRLAYVESVGQLAARSSGANPGPVPEPPPPVDWPKAVLGGVLGEIRAPIRDDPVPGTIDGQARLTAAEVQTILANAAARSLVTRAGIRLPPGKAAQVFISVVNNPHQDGQAPAVLGTFRTPDATVFSWDVCVQKARTVVFFSNNQRAYSARTVGFMAVSHFPPGIDSRPPGPFNGLQERFSAPLLTGTGTPNPNLPNGITIFPGGFPLYRNGVLIGAVGVSGDGIDQDDLIGASGTPGFQPDPAIRADNTAYLDVRLPYAKFPRDPMLSPPIAPLPDGFQNLAAADAPGNIANLSARGWIAPDGTLILGFVAAADSPTPVLLRGAGPALAALGVDDALAAPAAALYDASGHGLAANAGWSSAADPAALAATAARVGAFPFVAGSPDDAIGATLAGGAYTMVLRPHDGAAGTALAELYDAGPAPAGALRNVSARGYVEGSRHLLITGLVVAAGADRTVLIRAVGPGLASLGVPAPLAAPQLRLFNSEGQVVAEGAPWDSGSNADEIRSVSAAVGAFSLGAGTADQVLLLSLPAGSYTVQVGGADDRAGEALAEIYAVP